jgi:hypothetical protein
MPRNWAACRSVLKMFADLVLARQKIKALEANAPIASVPGMAHCGDGDRLGALPGRGSPHGRVRLAAREIRVSLYPALGCGAQGDSASTQGFFRGSPFEAGSAGHTQNHDTCSGWTMRATAK